jgi:phage-related protein
VPLTQVLVTLTGDEQTIRGATVAIESFVKGATSAARCKWRTRRRVQPIALTCAKMLVGEAKKTAWQEHAAQEQQRNAKLLSAHLTPW